MISGGVTQVIIDVVAKFTDNVTQPAEKGQKTLDGFGKSVDKTKKQLGDLGKTKTQVNLEAKDKATAAIKKVMASVKSFAGKTYSFGVKVLDYATRPLRGILNFFTGMQGVITAVIGGMAVKQLVAGPMALADQLAQTQITFETMLKSEEKAKKMMADIEAFTPKTPFETVELAELTQKMLARGWTQENVLKDLQRIGDTSAALGMGAEGIDRISLALGQMRMKGKLTGEEMRQLSEAGVHAYDYLSAGLGVNTDRLFDMISKNQIDVHKGIEIILQGMEENAGMMENIVGNTLKGVWRQIQSTFKTSIFAKWGKGLKQGALNGLQQFSKFLDKNRPTLEKWGNHLEILGETISTNLVNSLERLANKFQSVLASDRFKEAETMWDKMKIVWDEIVVQPFTDWWNSKGKAWLEDKAGEMGETIGNALKAGILTLLGIDASDAVEDGYSIGKSFAAGFLEGFDAKFIASRIGEELKTLLPGGEKPSTGGIMTAAALGFMFRKPLGKVAGAGLKKGGGALMGLLGLGGKGATGTAATAGVAEAATAAAGATGAAQAAAQTVPIFGPTGEVLKQVTVGAQSATGAGAAAASAAGSAAKATGGMAKVVGVLGKVGKGLLKAAPFVVAGYNIATAEPEERPRTTLGQIGSLGGMYGGAAIGTAIAPGIGTVAGGIIGAVVGDPLIQELYDSAEPYLESFFDMTENWGKSLVARYTEQGIGKPLEMEKTLPGYIKELYGTAEPYLENFFEATENWGKSLVEPGRGRYTVGEGQETAAGMWFKGVGYTEALLEDTLFNTDWWRDKWDEAVQNGQYSMNENLPTFREQFSDSLFNPDWWRGKWDTAVQNGQYSMNENLPTFREQFSDSLFNPDWWRGKWDEAIENGKYSMNQNLPTLGETMKKIFENTIFDSKWWADKWGKIKEWGSQSFASAEAFSEEKRQAGAAQYYTGHAAGGFMRKPHLGIVAEEGPESIIPLKQSRRAAALSLWAQTGRILGVKPYAEGGIAGAATSAGNGLKIDVGGIHFHVSGGGEGGSLLEGLRAQAEEIKNELCAMLDEAINQAFENMPQQI